MVLNLASAALIVQEYNTTGMVTYTNFCLSMTELVLICLVLPAIWSIIIEKKDFFYFCLSVPMLLNAINNIVYSSFIIHFYNKNLVYNEQFIWYSIAILVTNSMSLLGCFQLTGN